MTYKSVIFGYCVDGDDVEVYLVVPEHVTTGQIFSAEMDEEGDYEVICEAFSQECADLIAMLLNDYEMAGHA